MEVSFLFNADSEFFLKSNRDTYTIESNKKNQEFEYFILWLEDEPLFSNKRYDSDYLDFISIFKDVKVTADRKNVKTWCCDLSNKREEQIKNSKLRTTRFAIKNKLCHKSTSIIEDLSSYEDGFLYKEEFGVSGSGNFYFDNQRKITFPLIKEQSLKRVFDFSALIEEDEITIYQNHIDDYFQYRGTTLGLNFDYFDWIDSYRKNIQIIKNEFFCDNPLSIDSFLYDEDKQEKVYFLTEVNNRKTMRYNTKQMRKKFFSKQK